MLSIVIQAGGNSSRMGTDKGLVKLAGKPLVNHILEKIWVISDDVTIISNHPQNYLHLGLPVFSDPIPGAGALPGLLTALRTSKSNKVLLLACDMPFVNLNFIQYMITKIHNSDAIVPYWDDQYQTVQAIYTKKTCIPAIEKCIEQGKRRMISFFDQISVLPISPEEINKFDPEGLTFFNINTPEDLQTAEKMIQKAT